MIEEKKKPQRIRIQNDAGPGYMTTLVDDETGESLAGVYHLRVLDISVSDIPKAVLWTHMPAVDVIADVSSIVEVCPFCKTAKPEAQSLSKDFRLNVTVDDCEIDASIEKLKELQKMQRATHADKVYPAEALTAFVEWMGYASGDAMFALARQFYEAQGWSFDGDYYKDISKTIQQNYPD